MRTDRFGRLFAPRSIAVVGGGPWCAAIIGAARRIGYAGEIFPVHPEGREIAGIAAVRSLADWPGTIDAAFIGVNRHATIDVVADLAALGAGGAVCFASGFSEAAAEDAGGAGLQARLLQAAGGMPILGPNCYGFVNALDRAAIWPDQHGMRPLERGVAILTQSSNIAINLTMQRRALPLGFIAACGNMAQTSQAAIGRALAEDPRITAIGLHVEGFGDLREWESLASAAHARGLPLVALKVGASDEARAATVSHTASLAGSDAGAQALLDRLGIPRVGTVPAFLETLKLLHMEGPLASNRIGSISCSGGEASLVADMALGYDLAFPPLEPAQRTRLREVLGPMVALANPLDYHTYIWRDADRMGAAWAAMADGAAALTLSVVDYPHTDAADWACATQAAITARAVSGKPFAVAASLPELMPEETAAALMAGGVVPMAGLAECLAAAEAAARVRAPDPVPLLLPGNAREAVLLDEAAAKAELAGFGVPVPKGGVAADAGAAADIATRLTGPLALKGTGLAHKSEAGAVRLGLAAEDIAGAARDMGGAGFLVEEMVQGGVAELLVGVTRDPAHGFVLTLGAGGVMTELMRDTVSLLLPATRAAVDAALGRLRCNALLQGFRGRPAADRGALLDAVMAVQDYVTAHADAVEEVEINPLICTPVAAVAADALIRRAAENGKE